MNTSIYRLTLAFFLLVFVNLSYSQEGSDLKTEFEKLKEEYEKVVRDRDNILAQTKNLLQYKTELRETEDQINMLTNKNKELKVEKEALSGQVADLKEHVELLGQDKAELLDKIKELNNYIEKMEVEYKIVGNLKKQLSQQERENQRLKGEIGGLENKIKKSEGQALGARADTKIYKRQYNELRKNYQEALSVNKKLERKLAEIPKKFAEIARENKLLVKETAFTHYNLGVFYTEEKQYKRAIAEFEKAIELNPDDAYAYFNLGYIYSEYLVDRPKAVDYFKRYLRLASKEDKDVDWVKKYILTWQTWDAKQPIK